MAVYFLYMKTFGRAAGGSAVRASSYRSGERLRDERSGKTFDHESREGVLHKEIVLPEKFADSEMSWAQDRATLWNAAEAAEPRKNARVAREILVALPAEMNAEQRLALVRGFAHDLADRYGFAVDLAIHAPRTDPRNHHAHLLATTRELQTDGFGAKTTLEINDTRRRERGLQPFFSEVTALRERWSAAVNGALTAAHIDARVDHRSLAAQGIDREPQPHLPRAAVEIERRGERSFVAERLRAEHLARVQERAARMEPAATRGAAAPPSDLEEIWREARERWLAMRAEAKAAAPAAAHAPTAAAHTPTPDDDLGR